MCDDSFDIAMVDNNLEKMYAYYDGDDSAMDNLITITLEGYMVLCQDLVQIKMRGSAS